MIERFHALAPGFAAGEYENTFTNAQGERRVIAWRAAPVLGPDGRAESIVAGGIDITERQRLEDEKEREREFLNAIANEAPSLLCLIDETGRVAPHATNKAFEAALEYEPHETGGHLFWERYVDGRDADDVRALIEQVIAGQPIGEHDHRWVSRSGRQLIVAWTCAPLPRVDERTMFLLSGVDVTQRNRREVELQRERDATTTVLQTIPSLIAVLDADGVIVDRDVDNPLAAVNRAFRETLGWQDEQLVGRRLVDLLDEPDRDVARTAIATAVGGGLSGELESKWRRADGSPVLVAWRAASVTDATLRRQQLVLVTGMDVTERRARELENERQRDILNAITNAIPSFIAAVDPDGHIVEDGVNPPLPKPSAGRDRSWRGGAFSRCSRPRTSYAGRLAIANAANGVPQGDLESRWLRRDGEERVVAWTTLQVVDGQGRSLVLVSGSDVTERSNTRRTSGPHARASSPPPMTRAAASSGTSTTERSSAWSPSRSRSGLPRQTGR